MGAVADQIETAISNVLASGHRTADIRGSAPKIVSTQDMGDAILGELDKLSA
jgi:3-isopropylmalate dehydrogenase